MKGVHRRVILIDEDCPEVFEQAIFIVSDEYLRQAEGSLDQLMARAEALAAGYLREAAPVRREKKKPPFGK